MTTTATAHGTALASSRVRQVVSDYVTLTKPKVQSLLLLTTVTTMYVAGDPSLALVFWTVLGGSLASGGAGAVNHSYDRDIDAQMARPAARPVPTGRVELTALYLFAIVFYWTPPHFWALSLLMKDDYARVGVPMMPVVRGEDETRQLIVLYTVLLVALTLMPVVFGYFGLIYGAAAVVLGGVFMSLSLRLWREAERRSALRTYL